MFTPGTLLNRLYERLLPAAENRRIDDLRVGLSYVGVKLDNGQTGIAAVLPDTTLSAWLQPMRLSRFPKIKPKTVRRRPILI